MIATTVLRRCTATPLRLERFPLSALQLLESRRLVLRWRHMPPRLGRTRTGGTHEAPRSHGCNASRCAREGRRQAARNNLGFSTHGCVIWITVNSISDNENGTAALHGGTNTPRLSERSLGWQRMTSSEQRPQSAHVSEWLGYSALAGEILWCTHLPWDKTTLKCSASVGPPPKWLLSARGRHPPCCTQRARRPLRQHLR